MIERRTKTLERVHQGPHTGAIPIEIITNPNQQYVLGHLHTSSLSVFVFLHLYVNRDLVEDRYCNLLCSVRSGRRGGDRIVICIKLDVSLEHDLDTKTSNIFLEVLITSASWTFPSGLLL